MNEAKNQACPFCGQQPIVVKGKRHSNGEWTQIPMVWCKPCGVTKWGDTDDEALVKWNTRAGGRQPEPSETGETKHVCISDLLAAVKSWRTAEVHHAALTLELRDGDELMAKFKLEDATRELRIAADAYVKAANK